MEDKGEKKKQKTKMNKWQLKQVSRAGHIINEATQFNKYRSKEQKSMTKSDTTDSFTINQSPREVKKKTRQIRKSCIEQ